MYGSLKNLVSVFNSDVTSLFTNTPLEEKIRLTCDILFEAKPDLKKDLQRFFSFPQVKPIFL